MTLFDDIRARPVPAPSHRAVIWAASACAVMSGAAIAPTIPAIEAALSGAPDGTVWGRIALVVPAVLIMLAGPWIGRQSGRVDQRAGFVASLIAMALFGVLGGFANGFGWLIATRIGLGIATAATLCFATAAITSLFQGPARGLVISRQAAINTFGGVVFVLLGGLLSQLGWRFPFSLYLLTLPVAYFASTLEWHPAAPITGNTPPPNTQLWRQMQIPLLVVGLAMTAFYLIPTQVPFLNLLMENAALSGLAIACATLLSGLVSLNIRRLVEAAGAGAVLAAAVFTGVLGLIELGLSSSVFAVLLAAVLVGMSFGALLPLMIQRIMAHGSPQTANIIAGYIASALYAGQVAASLFALGLGHAGTERLPFFAMALIIILTALTILNKEKLVPTSKWIWDHLA
ncbi:MFS transporter [Litoreibacter janthinus]|uniref:Predicted arabinose efflux permease, MFS family n=1 Tax=Litoreibacter janthinus TaxID=670154 RepID=A0A1I6GDA1_9RHOB|nr:MFS transporter [Litoreibacter janthinus]SFR40169.1 Predicted arabinose efflux permease, MFS family [Litoreibacter janthinus]